MKRVLLFFVALLFYGCGSVDNNNADANTPSSVAYKSSWVKNVDIDGFTSSSVRDNEGNFYFASTDSKDFRISKLDADANIIWSKKYETELENFGGIITIDKDNNILLGGIQSSDFSNYDDYEVIAMKFSPDGELLWQSFNPTSKSDIVYDITTDSQANIYIVGGLNAGTDDEAFVVKYSSAGRFEWIKSINSNYFTNAHSVVVDEEDNIYITGVTGRDIFFAKYLPDGTRSIYKEYKTTADERSTHMCLGKDGYIYVGGYYILDDGEEPELFVKKIDKFGDEIYFTVFDYIEGMEYIHAVNADENGNVFLYGEYYIATNDETKLFLTQVNSVGSITNKYLFDGNAYLGNLLTKTDLSLDKDNNIYISGPGFVKLTGDESNQGSYVLKLVPVDENQTL